jgi:hypothetical protein
VNNNYNSNTVVKQDFAVVKQVDERAAHMTDRTRHQSWQITSPPPPPLPDHAGSIPEYDNAMAHLVILSSFRKELSSQKMLFLLFKM